MKMPKKFLLVLWAVVLTVLFAGCSDGKTIEVIFVLENDTDTLITDIALIPKGSGSDFKKWITLLSSDDEPLEPGEGRDVTAQISANKFTGEWRIDVSGEIEEGVGIGRQFIIGPLGDESGYLIRGFRVYFENEIYEIEIYE